MIAFGGRGDTAGACAVRGEPHGGTSVPVLGLEGRNGNQAVNIYPGNAGTGYRRIWHSSSFSNKRQRADGDHRGELNHEMRTAAVSAVATRPSPLRCLPFSAPERRQARISKRSDMSATSRKSVSGATRPTGQRPSPKNTAVSLWTRRRRPRRRCRSHGHQFTNLRPAGCLVEGRCTRQCRRCAHCHLAPARQRCHVALCRHCGFPGSLPERVGRCDPVGRRNPRRDRRSPCQKGERRSRHHNAFQGCRHRYGRYLRVTLGL